MKLVQFSFSHILLLALVTCGAASQAHKYDIKSAIITFEQVMDMGGFKSTEKIMVYFDDYGQKECRETYSGKNIKESSFSDGKNLYLTMYEQKTVYERGTAYRGTEMKFDWAEVSKKDKDSGKAKKLANVTVAGKTCESFQHVSQYGTTVFAGWKGITLLTDLTGKGMKSTIKAVKIEETTPPAEKFKAPAGFPIKKM